MKLGDLGFSTMISDQKYLKELAGTPLYLAPELIKQQHYDFKVFIKSYYYIAR